MRLCFYVGCQVLISARIMQINPEGAHISTRKEDFSYAYIYSIASVVGYAVTKKPTPMDNVGIDISIEVPGKILDCLSPAIDAQVKCTSRDLIKNGFIKYPLDGKTYNRLVDKTAFKPQILIIVLVPKDISLWVNHGKRKLRKLTLMRSSAYWMSIKGENLTDNRNKTVKIPIDQRFTSGVLADLMSKAAGRVL